MCSETAEKLEHEDVATVDAVGGVYVVVAEEDQAREGMGKPARIRRNQAILSSSSSYWPVATSSS